MHNLEAIKLSLNNKVSIHAVLGEQIPVVVVPQQNLFSVYPNVHGVIGYDVFIKFEIEIDPARKIITFRPAALAELSPDYQKIPLTIEDSRPLISSKVFFSDSESMTCALMLDTGSSLGLLMKTSDLKKIPAGKSKVLGRGFNGNVMGVETVASRLLLDTFEMTSINTGVTYSDWQNHASVGMEVMRNYTVVLNYCKSYAGFRKVL